MLYQGEKFDEQFGMEFGKIILFESELYDTAGEAMVAFNKFPLPDLLVRLFSKL